MSYINVNNLTKIYSDQIVLERINLSIEKGAFVSIVGASGCGKSTFLKMLLGQEVASTGEILLEGEPIASEPNADRGIVFQRYSVFPHLTVLQNVMLSLTFEQSPLSAQLWGAKKHAARQRALDMIEAVGLSHAKNKYPDQLSGGMQQRLAIAQAFIKRPRILLLDEPFGALDPGIRGDMHTLVLALWKETGTTVFMVTHDLSEGFHLGTRLLVFDKIRQDAQAPERYGAAITYDIPIDKQSHTPLPEQLMQTMQQSEPSL